MSERNDLALRLIKAILRSLVCRVEAFGVTPLASRSPLGRVAQPVGEHVTDVSICEPVVDDPPHLATLDIVCQ